MKTAHQTFRRRLPDISWKYRPKVRNEEVREKTTRQKLEHIIKKRRRIWFGCIFNLAGWMPAKTSHVLGGEYYKAKAGKSEKETIRSMP